MGVCYLLLQQSAISSHLTASLETSSKTSYPRYTLKEGWHIHMITQSNKSEKKWQTRGTDVSKASACSGCQNSSPFTNSQPCINLRSNQRVMLIFVYWKNYCYKQLFNFSITQGFFIAAMDFVVAVVFSSYWWVKYRHFFNKLKLKLLAFSKQN